MKSFHAYELELYQKPGFFAGFDEVGRGPLAGPVVAACVILPMDYPIDELEDSKLLRPQKREALTQQIRSSVPHGIGICSVEEIDRLNIFQASMLAMQKAYENMGTEEHFIHTALIDGHLPSPYLKIPQIPIVKGDTQVACIAAASILAKTYRDNLMDELDQKHPEYGFAKHKGYPTKLHRQILQQLGPISEHRRSFKLI